MKERKPNRAAALLLRALSSSVGASLNRTLQHSPAHSTSSSSSSSSGGGSSGGPSLHDTLGEPHLQRPPLSKKGQSKNSPEVNMT